PQIGAALPDIKLLQAAFQANYRVLMPRSFAELLVEGHPEYRWQTADGPVDLVEVFAAGVPSS
ncbi:MAG: hypothetical protein AAFY06_01085, partial [Pseudomonadota bacterium]